MPIDKEPLSSDLVRLELWPVYLRFPMVSGLTFWGSTADDEDHLCHDLNRILVVRTLTNLPLLRGASIWPNPDRLDAILSILSRHSQQAIEANVAPNDFCRALMWTLRPLERWPKDVRNDTLDTLNLAWDMACTLNHAETIAELRPDAPLGIIADALTGRVRAFEGVEGPHELPPPHVVGEGYTRLVGRIQQWVRVLDG